MTSGVTLASTCDAPELPCQSTEEDTTSGSISEGAPCRLVKSSGPGAGLSEFKSSQCYSLAVCCVSFGTLVSFSVPQFTHRQKGGTYPTEESKGSNDTVYRKHLAQGLAHSKVPV